jgi:hypothetical protein
MTQCCARRLRRHSGDGPKGITGRDDPTATLTTAVFLLNMLMQAWSGEYWYLKAGATALPPQESVRRARNATPSCPPHGGAK